MKKVLVTGAGGFIGHHLTKYLVKNGYWVRGVDLKNPEFEATKAHDFKLLDLRNFENASAACEGIDEVYNLAADMGGIGYITAYHAQISRNNSLININMLDAAKEHGIKDFLFTSSACVYPGYKQTDANVTPLKEVDAYPAEPEEGYGWEKLYAEKLCEYYRRDFGIQTRIVRFHNVYGPLGTYDGGKEKSPAALCRKVALANNPGTIEIWGDGNQTRSYMYIDECVEGIYKIMRSGYCDPLNLGTEEMVSVNQLADYIIQISGKSITKTYDVTKPQGVRGRNSDNTLLRKTLNAWNPELNLAAGLKATYSWIEAQVRASVTAIEILGNVN